MNLCLGFLAALLYMVCRTPSLNSCATTGKICLAALVPEVVRNATAYPCVNPRRHSAQKKSEMNSTRRKSRYDRRQTKTCSVTDDDRRNTPKRQITTAFRQYRPFPSITLTFGFRWGAEYQSSAPLVLATLKSIYF